MADVDFCKPVERTNFFSLEFFLTSVSVAVWLREKLSPSPVKQLKLKNRFSLNISQDPLRFLGGCYKFFMFVLTD